MIKSKLSALALGTAIALSACQLSPEKNQGGATYNTPGKVTNALVEGKKLRPIEPQTPVADSKISNCVLKAVVALIKPVQGTIQPGEEKEIGTSKVINMTYKGDCNINGTDDESVTNRIAAKKAMMENAKRNDIFKDEKGTEPVNLIIEPAGEAETTYPTKVTLEYADKSSKSGIINSPKYGPGGPGGNFMRELQTNDAGEAYGQFTINYDENEKVLDYTVSVDGNGMTIKEKEEGYAVMDITVEE